MNINDTSAPQSAVDPKAFEEALREIAGDQTAMGWEQSSPRRDIGPRS